ncbi:HipA domain-containing protein [Neptuniibacter sp. QD72_48]|uniref:HipA domain-containing protein n=1 Tax=Neptuniibacter sp. QD72_48 TaxID=3398214 RepID=UPI0039F4DA3A
MDIRILNAFINDEHIGILTDTNGIWSFEYTSAWINKGYALSPALPLQKDAQIDKSTIRPVQNFFDNLLPEEAARKLMANEAGVDVADRFALLAYYGAETAGAITLLKEAQHPAIADAYAELTYESLSARIRALPQSPLTKESPKRMSLAGAQHKLAVCFDHETQALSEPKGATASTHVLKPDHNDIDNYPHSSINEWFVMRLADIAGLSVPATHYLHVPETVYLIDRFDRDTTTDKAARKHILDGCQMLQLPPESKYRNCTIENLVKLSNMCVEPAATRQKVFNWLIFNFLVGNSDAHLKNLSFFINANGYSLTPHYDLLNTTGYGSTSQKWMHANMVTKLGDVQVFEGVTIKTLIATGQEMKVGSVKNITQRISTLCNKVSTGAQNLYETLEKTNSDKPDHLKLTPGELQHLRKIIYGPLSEAARQLQSS